MKKYRLFSLAALLFATACTQNDPVVEPEATPAGMHFYGVALPETTRGAAQHDRLWHNGTTIKVKFLNGSTAMREMVEEYTSDD